MIRFSCAERSWFPAVTLRYGGSAVGKELVQIDGRVFRGVLEAEGNLLFAEANTGRRLVNAGATFAQGAFHMVTQFAAGTLEIAGYAGLVLIQFSTDGGESFFRGVIQA